jgi:hypothetical protein
MLPRVRSLPPERRYQRGQGFRRVLAPPGPPRLLPFREPAASS